MSVWRNDTNCRCIFLFLRKNSARKELTRLNAGDPFWAQWTASSSFQVIDCRMYAKIWAIMIRPLCLYNNYKANNGILLVEHIETETKLSPFFADDISKCILLNQNVWISLKISRKFVPKDRINNIPALVQTMAWRRLGDKPLFEARMVSLPHWVNNV